MSTATYPIPGIVPPLDPGFRPLALAYRAFCADVAATGRGVPLVLALERSPGEVSRRDLHLFPPDSPEAERNLPMLERVLKTMLWLHGGWKVTVGGPQEIGDALRAIYRDGGARAFDVAMMTRYYEHAFTIVSCPAEDAPEAQEPTRPIGGHLDGCRIGLDLGASDRKVAAVQEGEALYCEEVVWDPRPQTDPTYHFDEIMTALRTAAAYLPRVEAIGISSAGVYVNNRVRVASLFRGVPEEHFTPDITDLFLRVQQAWGGIPLEVINDGDVTALAGAMSSKGTAVLGVAMGSSEAAGYITSTGSLTSWLNELAFVPIDMNPEAPADEWSGDVGCGVQYLSQQAVGRLISVAGLPIDPTLGLPTQLHAVQRLATAGDECVRPLYETIGVYLGYALAYYAEWYEIQQAEILGRVTSGMGGQLILEQATRVLHAEFPALAAQLQLHLPDEANRRVGQAIAAASLPVIRCQVSV